MFIEVYEQAAVTLMNLNSGTSLKLSYSSNFDRYQVYFYGADTGITLYYKKEKGPAEEIYAKVRSKWVGNDYVEVIHNQAE